MSARKISCSGRELSSPGLMPRFWRALRLTIGAFQCALTEPLRCTRTHNPMHHHKAMQHGINLLLGSSVGCAFLSLGSMKAPPTDMPARHIQRAREESVPVRGTRRPCETWKRYTTAGWCLRRELASTSMYIMYIYTHIHMHSYRRTYTC